jgi:miniconductance mechanosensitive channel
MYKYLYDSFIYSGLSHGNSYYLSMFIIFIVMLFFCWLSNYIAKKIISRAVYKIVVSSQNRWDDVFYQNRVFSAISHVAPALVIMGFAGEFQLWRDFLNKSALIYMALIAYIAFGRIIDSIDCIYKTYEVSKEKPVTNYLQVLKIFCIIVCVIISIGIFVEKSPWTLLSGIGAMTAVIMVIFKDTIMGLSAGIQLSANKMLHIGDWIEMPKYGADGEVIEITLNTVKVQNWDKTLIMIPVYCLISESFKNWRGMYMTGGRRIKRAIYLDMTSIKFCGPETIEDYKKDELIGGYIESIISERAARAQAQAAVDVPAPAGEGLSSGGDNETKNAVLPAGENKTCEADCLCQSFTNAGIFREYIHQYLKKHPHINENMYLMARQLQPGAYGLPVEIYAFCRETEWSAYESVQAQIIEHMLSVVPRFGLRIFQRPAA